MIRSFCTSSETVPFCIIAKYDVTTILPINEIQMPTHPLIKKYEKDYSSLLSKFIIGVHKLSHSHTIVATPIQKIIKKCIHIPMKGRHYDYLISTPNSFDNSTILC